MITLVIFNLLLLAIITLGLFLVKKYIKGERGERTLFLLASIFTIVCHYSSFIRFLFSDGGMAIDYLRNTPNLILPIYPCNVVMWSCLIFGFLKNKKSNFCVFLSDYIFWFGIVSTLVGMFANVDFINDPDLSNYEVTKSIVAHATLLFNVLLLPIFGYVKADLWRNMRNILISVLGMFFIGMYCNLVFTVLVSKEVAYDVNSMFLLHSPFSGMEFLTYPIISLMALFIYFLLFAILEFFFCEKGKRFHNRFASWIRQKRIK